jgi:hypothetical protein
MCPQKTSRQSRDDPKLTLELDHCYRGVVEIWKDEKGKIVKVTILR